MPVKRPENSASYATVASDVTATVDAVVASDVTAAVDAIVASDVTDTVDAVVVEETAAAALDGVMEELEGFEVCPSSDDFCVVVASEIFMARTRECQKQKRE